MIPITLRLFQSLFFPFKTWISHFIFCENFILIEFFFRKEPVFEKNGSQLFENWLLFYENWEPVFENWPFEIKKWKCLASVFVLFSIEPRLTKMKNSDQFGRSFLYFFVVKVTGQNVSTFSTFGKFIFSSLMARDAKKRKK